MESQPKPPVTGYPAAGQPPYSSSAAAAGPGGPAQGTAYPYPAPQYYAAPQPHVPGPYHNPSDGYAYGGSSVILLRRLIIIICVCIFLVFGLATFILWLALRPRIPEFVVTSASVSSFNLSGNQQLSADFNLTLSVRNRNKKMGMSYDSVEAAVFYGPEPISETTLPPFYQGKGDSTVLPARLAAVAEYVDPDLGSAIARERSGGAGVNFHVRLMAWVRFGGGAWRSRRHVMRVLCEDVKIRFSNATAAVGSLVGQPKPCQVDL